ncbi:arginine-hydroxylase NDUFAF5, mitochondrial isoform X2 [Lycorma delicatula]|uniref:arginine-hydroxylase NDUFAF5, mitochondrial isoform X2 n=1 Tax=Lycorma delicatula TaxID=130591 RepID=UPI003F514858
MITIAEMQYSCLHSFIKFSGNSMKNKYLVLRYSTLGLSQDSVMNVFDRKAKLLQRERAALQPDVHVYDYLKDEIGYRLSDRIFDIKRKFNCVVDLGCSRGYVSKNVLKDSVEKLILCDMSPAQLEQASSPEDGVQVERLVVDEEDLPFEENSVDLVVSNLALHWVNNLPGALSQILRCLVNDGAFLATIFGGDTLFELRCSLQLAELERKGGISPHVSPFTQIRDIGSLMTRAGFTMLTIDTDEITVGYPTMFELMRDLKASAIYQHVYGKDGNIPATFQVIYLVGWKPHPSQPKPLERGSGKISLKDIHRLDKIAKEIKKVKLEDADDDNHKR